MSRVNAPIVSQRAAPLAMNYSQALVEAQRCLGCYDAPCTQACPVHIDVPGFIHRLADENLAGSNDLLVERNPLAAICGLVCPTMDLCEGACVLPDTGQSPIRIGALQYLVASRFQVCEPLEQNPGPRRIAVVGGGPSSIGCAIVLRRRGHEVHLFERASSLGGLIGQVIPAYRLPAEAAAHDLGRLQQSGINFHLGADITPEGLAELEREYDAVFIGIGLGDLNIGAVPGSDLDGVTLAMDFMKQARLYAGGRAAKPDVGETVVIAGGGNVALDAAILARQFGAERSIVLYRRSLAEMPAWRSEYIDAAAAGVEFRWLSTIRNVMGKEGRVKAVEVQPMRRTGVGPDGRRGVEKDPEASPYLLPCNKVLLALGQTLDRTWIESLGLDISSRGTVRVDPRTYQTSRLKIFSGGEAASGGTTVVACIAQGLAAGQAMHEWLETRGEWEK